jgi:glycosyltransferase involved in cell wall biosynthesis
MIDRFVKGDVCSLMRVLMLTPTIDLADRLNTGFAHDWVKALSRQVENVDVLCRVAGAMDLPSNVTVAGLDSSLSTSRLKLLLAFHRAISRRIRNVDVVFAHFIPPYAIAAVPSARLHGIPLVHWNANKIVHMQMRLAHLLVNRIVTSTPDSYPFSGPKVTVVGQGVDFELFAPPKDPPDGGRVVITVGRLTPSKNLELQIEAASLLLKKPGFEDVTFRAVGDEPWWTHGYYDELEAYIAKRGLAERFQLLGGKPFAEIAASYQGSTLMLSTSKSGSLDKVVLEAMGCGLPVLATGHVFEPLLGEDRDLLLVKDDDPHELAERLAKVLSMDPVERHALGLRLRQHAMENHSLDRLMTNLVAVFREEINRRRR